MSNRHDPYAYAAVATLGVGVAFETFRLVTPGHTWPGFLPRVSQMASIALIAFFLSTAVALLLRRRHRFFASAAWGLSILSPLLMIVHGAVTRVGGSRLGLLYIPVALVLGFAVKRTFDDGERTTLPTHNPGGRAPGAQRAYHLHAPPKQ